MISACFRSCRREGISLADGRSRVRPGRGKRGSRRWQWGFCRVQRNLFFGTRATTPGRPPPTGNDGLYGKGGRKFPTENWRSAHAIIYDRQSVIVADVVSRHRCRLVWRSACSAFRPRPLSARRWPRCSRKSCSWITTCRAFAAMPPWLSRTLLPEQPIIFVSGTIGEELAVELVKGGATDYVLKDRLGRLPVSISSPAPVSWRIGRRRRITRPSFGAVRAPC